ncbi:ketopantoate reductase C-terminal domain-containing protein [Candidatus Merdisoma sp. JLR.KK006]|uniref:ketopantoate reductase C-terminal domain-containing protein n=1 Tax=Candidatus Merdisoma sp. JLR.KK006 TaxID=3112626 RepID=UPI002FEEE567
MELGLQEDIAEANLKVLADLSPAGTSMQRDIAKGGASEIEGLVYGVEKMVSAYGVDMPVYKRIIDELKARGLK